MDNLKVWFGDSVVKDASGNPLVVYHGTSKDFDKFKGLMFWASTDPELANHYADMRHDQHSTSMIYPVYMKIQSVFDADELPNTVTIGGFFTEVLNQARANGNSPMVDKIAPLIAKLKAGAQMEESGPHYSKHDIWNNSTSLMGNGADDIIKQIFILMGFDGIKLTEAGYMTYGVFYRNQVKSAIGNTEYSSDDSIVKESVDSDNFKQWFGNSVVVDDHDNPLAVYHATNANFDSFSLDKTSNSSRFGPGFYFTADTKTLDAYSGGEGGNIMPVYLKMQNPNLDGSMTADQVNRFFDALQDKKFSNGFDATDAHETLREQIIEELPNAYSRLASNSLYFSKSDWLRGMTAANIDGVIRTVFGHKEYVVFSPNQIKSKTGNNGEYSSDDSIIKENDSNLTSWFGKSVVKNKDGSPRKVYHGTNADFNSFSLDNRKNAIDQYGMGIYLATNPEVSDAYTGGDGGNIMPLYVRLEKPMKEDQPAFSKSVVQKLISAAPNLDESLENYGDVGYEGKRAVFMRAVQSYLDFDNAIQQLNTIANDFWVGHDQAFLNLVHKVTKFDGVLIRDYGKDNYIIVVWNPNQVKSAVGNSGEYSSDTSVINEMKYPLATDDDWYGDRQYKTSGGKMVYMSPDEYLSKVRSLELDDTSLDNIDDLANHIKSGRTLDPLKIYKDGKEDGRHRAYAAKKLGIKQVPVIVYSDDIQDEIAEGWKSALTGLGTAGALALGGMAYKNNNVVPVAPVAKPAIVKAEPKVPLQTDTAAEKFLAKIAQSSGIKGKELAQFLAQCAHETGDFKYLKELGGKQYFTKKYDITGNPAKAKVLGNTKAGDGAKYHGRGFIHLTGKEQYINAGKALGIDLVNNPSLAEKPDVAAKIAIWYWNHRVKPKVDDFDDTHHVTKLVNGRLKGIDDRVKKFAAYNQINEGASSIVYHFSDLFSGYNIVKDGEFKLSVLKGADIETQVSTKTADYFLSTTRTRNGGYHKSSRQGVLFNIDGNKINQRYKAGPVDYWNDRNPSKSYGRTHEAEDRIYSNQPTISLDVVTAVHILVNIPAKLDHSDIKRLKYAKAIMIKCKSNGIPVYVYDNNKSWLNQDTTKTIAIDRLKTPLADEYPPMYRGKPTYGLISWMELIFKKNKESLSKSAADKLYTLKYHPRDLKECFKADWHNAKKPTSSDYGYIKKIIEYMNTNKLKTIDQLLEHLKNKWINL